LELTRAGQVCYEYAVEQRKLNREFLQTLGAFKTGDTPSSLIIGASLTTLQSTLPDLITLYTQDYPLTDVKALTGKTHEIVTYVKEKKVDIGLVASTIDHLGLECVPLFDDHLCLLLPAGHPYQDRKALTIRDINELPMILFSKGTWYRILMDELFLRYAVFPDVKMEIDSFEAIIRLVSTCKVATMLPKSYLRHNLLENNELRIRDIPELEQTKRTTSLIFSNEGANNALIQPFIFKAKQYFPQAAE
jgi:DNA-binding transcriptional LysR family regulator